MKQRRHLEGLEATAQRSDRGSGRRFDKGGGIRRFLFVAIFVVVFVGWNRYSLDVLRSDAVVSRQKVIETAEQNLIDSEMELENRREELELAAIERKREKKEEDEEEEDEEKPADKIEDIDEEEETAELLHDAGSEEGEDTIANAQQGPKVLSVCTVGRNPRQGSIFRTNLMGMLGSGRYEYKMSVQGGCPWNLPRVRMIPYVKCCTQLPAVYKQVAFSEKTYDIVIVTGDEYCAVKSNGKFQYRQYYGDQVFSDIPGGSKPIFLPLGPRSEFDRVKDSEVIPAMARKYALNFVGSPTSIPRRILRDYFNSDHWKSSELSKNSFIHVTDSWTQKIDASKGYISAGEYRNVLLTSRFTLCPIGHNPEAYRIYEACEAGSIPILTLEEPTYVNHKCPNSYKPFVDAKAPFIFLKNWEELEDFMVTAGSNSTFLKERQTALKKWYKKYMSEMALEFEQVLESRYKKRLKSRPVIRKQMTPAKPN